MNEDFGAALADLRRGLRLRRETWPAGSYMFLGSPNCVAAVARVLITLSDQGISKDRMRPSLFRVDVDEAGEHWLRVWTPAVEDVLASDWTVVDDA